MNDQFSDPISEAVGRTEFLSTLAHELRNPLAPLSNGLRIIRLAKNDPGEIDRTLNVMDRQLQHLVHLIDALLEAGLINEGRIELSRERINLVTVLDEAVQQSRSQMDDLGHRLTLDLPGEAFWVEADARRLRQVFGNLLDNAAKYSGRGAQVKIFVERDGDEVVVSVTDEGIGLASDKLEKVFVMFAKADRALEKGQDGLGLGLAIARQLVELQGGTVTASSNGPGTGSTFVVRLPLAQAAENGAPASAAPAADAATENSGGGVRVLIVDDNRDFVSSLSIMLKIMGHEIKEAYDGVEALRVAATFRPEIVLLDIGMPKLNGYDACRVIREQPWGKDVTLVALTGWGGEEDVAHSREAGFDHHLVKPFDSGALEKIINEVRVPA